MPAKGKYSPETVKAITDAVLLGVPYRHAAAIAGISEQTFYDWMNNKPEFFESIKAAEADAVKGRLSRIRKAEDDTWTASAWFLERKYPNEFGKTVQESRITGEDGGAVKLIVEMVTKA